MLLIGKSLVLEGQERNSFVVIPQVVLTSFTISADSAKFIFRI